MHVSLKLSLGRELDIGTITQVRRTFLLDDLVAPHLAAAPVHISPPRGRGDVNCVPAPADLSLLRRGPPRVPSPGSACEHRRVVGRAPGHRQPHRRRVVVQRPVGHAVAHERAHGLRARARCRRPPRRGRSRSASRPLPGRSAPHLRVGRSRSPAPRAGPGEPARREQDERLAARGLESAHQRALRERVRRPASRPRPAPRARSRSSARAARRRAQEADVEAAVVELAQLLGACRARAGAARCPAPARGTRAAARARS